MTGLIIFTFFAAPYGWADFSRKIEYRLGYVREASLGADKMLAADALLADLVLGKVVGVNRQVEEVLSYWRNACLASRASCSKAGALIKALCSSEAQPELRAKAESIVFSTLIARADAVSVANRLRACAPNMVEQKLKLAVNLISFMVQKGWLKYELEELSWLKSDWPAPQNDHELLFSVLLDGVGKIEALKPLPVFICRELSLLLSATPQSRYSLIPKELIDRQLGKLEAFIPPLGDYQRHAEALLKVPMEADNLASINRTLRVLRPECNLLRAAGKSNICFEKLIRIAGDPQVTADIRAKLQSEISRLEFETKDMASGRRKSESLLAAAERSGQVEAAIWLHFQLGEMLQAQGESALAERHLRKHSEKIGTMDVMPWHKMFGRLDLAILAIQSKLFSKAKSELASLREEHERSILGPTEIVAYLEIYELLLMASEKKSIAMRAQQIKRDTISRLGALSYLNAYVDAIVLAASGKPYELVLDSVTKVYGLHHIPTLNLRRALAAAL